MASIEEIQSRKLFLTADPQTEENPHRPELRIWADDGDEEDAEPNVTLALGSMFGQASRFVEMTPDEARTLAVLLKQVADDIDSVWEGPNGEH